MRKYRNLDAVLKNIRGVVRNRQPIKYQDLVNEMTARARRKKLGGRWLWSHRPGSSSQGRCNQETSAAALRAALRTTSDSDGWMWMISVSDVM